MDELTKKIKNIPLHVKRWNLFAIIAPPVFLSAGLALLLSDLVSFGTMFWIGVTMMSVTAFVWWIWIVNTIYRLSQYMGLTHDDLDKAVDELISIKRDINKDKTQ